MRHARVVWGVALEDAPGKTDGGQCSVVKIAPKMFSPSNTLVETNGELEILNTGDDIFEGDEVIAFSDISGFWCRIVGGGGVGTYVAFEFVDTEDSSSSTSSSSGSDEVPENCDERETVSGPFYGKVISKACGMGSAPGEDSEGIIEMQDDLGMLQDRDYRDLSGRRGFAVRMQQGPESISGSASQSAQDDCYWMIVIVNFWRVVQVVTDVIFGEQSITIKRKNLTVWDDCSLPDEVIEGTDCPKDGSSSSTGLE